jgi:hypothetical protein
MYPTIIGAPEAIAVQLSHIIVDSNIQVIFIDTNFHEDRFRILKQALMTHTYSRNHCPSSFQLMMVFFLFLFVARAFLVKKTKNLCFMFLWKMDKTYHLPIFCQHA